MPPIRPERARSLLSANNRALQRSRRPLSPRQSALLALIAAGLTAREIAALQATAITMERGRLLVTLHRHGVTWKAFLPSELAPHVLVWLTERRLWGEPAPVFTGRQGRLTPAAVHQTLHRCRQKKRNPRG